MFSKFAVGLAIATSGFAATWTGQISDNACGKSHAKMLASHFDLKTDHDCTLACIKGGSTYVLVSAGKVYQISNHTFADLEKRAGEIVKLTGDLKGDTITVSKIASSK